MRTVRILVTVALVADSLLVLYSHPIGVQIFGDDQGKRRADCGAHLRAMRHDPHRTVRINPDESAGMERSEIHMRIVRERVGDQQAWGKAHASHQGARGEDASVQKITPADVLNRAHAISPAAVLIAARMRW